MVLVKAEELSALVSTVRAAAEELREMAKDGEAPEGWRRSVKVVAAEEQMRNVLGAEYGGGASVEEVCAGLEQVPVMVCAEVGDPPLHSAR
jgi:hypothetical protein